MEETIYWTAEQVRALPDDGNRYEVVWGELLVSPSPRPAHQFVLRQLFLALNAYLEREPVGAWYFSPSDISFDAESLVQPDLFVIPQRRPPKQWAEVRELLLVGEVLSPSTARHDRFAKRRYYQEHGVPLYWIVDIERERVEEWTPGATAPRFVEDRLLWHPAGADAPLVVELAPIFEALR